MNMFHSAKIIDVLLNAVIIELFHTSLKISSRLCILNRKNINIISRFIKNSIIVYYDSFIFFIL